jgi:predicted GIY-YIG superfamily endonuclease
VSKPHVLYRAYDAQGVLLYIGITMNPGNRFAQHSEDKPWWADVAEIRVEHFGSRKRVLAAERAAIQAERPRFNVIHNTGNRVAHISQRHQLVENQGRLCFFRDMSGYSRRDPLMLSYELSGDPITDDYLPDEISAKELLHMWMSRYVKDYNEPMRVWWSVFGPAISEYAIPYDIFQGDAPHFGRYYSNLADAHTRQPLCLHELPVIDKRWDDVRGDKGGFIQAATGWKPRALQEWVTPVEILDNYPVGGWLS